MRTQSKRKEMTAMLDRLLPVGSVVLLNNATKRIMVTGYCQCKEGDTTQVYDYAGCVYPEGFISAETTALFNHDQIKDIFHVGYQDEEQEAFKSRIVEVIKQVKSK